MRIVRERRTILTGVNANRVYCATVWHFDSKERLEKTPCLASQSTQFRILLFYQGSAKCELIDKASTATSVLHSSGLSQHMPSPRHHSPRYGLSCWSENRWPYLQLRRPSLIPYQQQITLAIDDDLLLEASPFRWLLLHVWASEISMHECRLPGRQRTHDPQPEVGNAATQGPFLAVHKRIWNRNSQCNSQYTPE